MLSYPQQIVLLDLKERIINNTNLRKKLIQKSSRAAIVYLHLILLLMEDKIKITIKLDAHVVNLEVKSRSEQSVREAEALLNRRYQDYREKYPNASSEQLWMYTALEIAIYPQPK